MSRGEREVQQQNDVVVKQERGDDDFVAPVRPVGSRGERRVPCSIQKVPSISDLSDHENSIGKIWNDFSAKMMGLTFHGIEFFIHFCNILTFFGTLIHPCSILIPVWLLMNDIISPYLHTNLQMHRLAWLFNNILLISVVLICTQLVSIQTVRSLISVYQFTKLIAVSDRKWKFVVEIKFGFGLIEFNSMPAL